MTQRQATKAVVTATQRRAGRPSREEARGIDALILDRTIAALRAARYATVSIDALAQDIGVTKQTIYRRFPSKSALIDAAIGHRLHALHAFARDTATVADVDPLEALRRYARQLFAMLMAPDTAGLAVFIDHAALTDTGFADRRRDAHVGLIAPLVAAIAGAQRAGRLVAGDAAAMADLLFDLLSGPAMRGRIDGGDASEEEQAFAARFAVFLALYAPS